MSEIDKTYLVNNEDLETEFMDYILDICPKRKTDLIISLLELLKKHELIKIKAYLDSFGELK